MIKAALDAIKLECEIAIGDFDPDSDAAVDSLFAITNYITTVSSNALINAAKSFVDNEQRKKVAFISPPSTIDSSKDSENADSENAPKEKRARRSFKVQQSAGPSSNVRQRRSTATVKSAKK